MKGYEIYNLKKYRVKEVWDKLKPQDKDVTEILNKHYDGDFLRQTEADYGLSTIQYLYLLAKYSTRH